MSCGRPNTINPQLCRINTINANAFLVSHRRLFTSGFTAIWNIQICLPNPSKEWWAAWMYIPITSECFGVLKVSTLVFPQLLVVRRVFHCFNRHCPLLLKSQLFRHSSCISVCAGQFLYPHFWWPTPYLPHLTTERLIPILANALRFPDSNNHCISVLWSGFNNYIQNIDLIPSSFTYIHITLHLYIIQV